MAEALWNQTAQKIFHYGVDRPVLYFVNPTTGVYSGGVPWEGMTSVSISPSGAENTVLYANNEAYASFRAKETLGATIEAYTYPPEFAQCDGTAALMLGVNIGQQNRVKFGFTFRTMIGSDAAGLNVGYLIHMVYGCTVSPSESQKQSVNESIEAATFSWEVATTPVNAPGFNPSSYIVVDSRLVTAPKLLLLENQLYGKSPVTSPNMPLPAALVTLLT
jgi:hypothetical protein